MCKVVEQLDRQWATLMDMPRWMTRRQYGSLMACIGKALVGRVDEADAFVHRVILARRDAGTGRARVGRSAKGRVDGVGFRG